MMTGRSRGTLAGDGRQETYVLFLTPCAPAGDIMHNAVRLM